MQSPYIPSRHLLESYFDKRFLLGAIHEALQFAWDNIEVSPEYEQLSKLMAFNNDSKEAEEIINLMGPIGLTFISNICFKSLVEFSNPLSSDEWDDVFSERCERILEIINSCYLHLL